MDFFYDLHFDDPLLNLATVLVAGILGGEILRTDEAAEGHRLDRNWHFATATLLAWDGYSY